MKTLEKLTVVLTLMGIGSLPAAAGSFGLVTGGITMTGVVDPGFNFLGLDFRGTVGLGTPDGTVLLTDSFASPNFGNTALVAINPVFDGTGVQVDFQTASFSLQGGGAIFNILGLGTTLAGPLSAPETDMLQPLFFSFLLTGEQAVAGTPNIQVTYALSQVNTLTTTAPTPEPAAVGLGAIGLGMIALVAARRRRAVV